MLPATLQFMGCCSLGIHQGANLGSRSDHLSSASSELQLPLYNVGSVMIWGKISSYFRFLLPSDCWLSDVEIYLLGCVTEIGHGKTFSDV